MGRLIARARAKGVRWYWLTRYWYMDTETGRESRIATAVMFGLVAVLQTVRVAVVALQPPAPDAPVQSYWWVVQLIIAIVAALISYAMMPKPQPPKPAGDDGPTVEDGRSVPIVDGPYWIPDEFILANKVVGRVPIKSGGKK